MPYGKDYLADACPEFLMQSCGGRWGYEALVFLLPVMFL